MAASSGGPAPNDCQSPQVSAWVRVSSLTPLPSRRPSRRSIRAPPPTQPLHKRLLELGQRREVESLLQRRPQRVQPQQFAVTVEMNDVGRQEHGRRVRAARWLRRRERVFHQAHDHAPAVQEQGGEDRLLGAEVQVDRALGEAAGLRDRLCRGQVAAPVAEQRGRSRKDARPARLLVLAAVGPPSRHAPPLPPWPRPSRRRDGGASGC